MMEFQHDFRYLQINGGFNKEECGYYEDFSSCGSSFSSSSGPLTPSPMSSRRPSVAEEGLVHNADPAANDRYFSPLMPTARKSMTYDGSLISQHFLPASTGDPAIFGDGLAIALQYQSRSKTEPNAINSTGGFHWDDTIYQQTLQGLEELPAHVSDRNFLETGNNMVHDRGSFQMDNSLQLSHIAFQEDRTIDPMQTNIAPTFLETNHCTFRTSTATIFEDSASELEESLFPSSSQAAFLDSSSGSSSEWPTLEQTNTITSGALGTEESTLATTAVDPDKQNGRDKMLAVRKNRNTRTAGRLDLVLSPKPLASKISKTDSKLRPKKMFSVCKKNVHVCGFEFLDGKTCPKRFARSEHCKRHIKRHGPGEVFRCPDPDCQRKGKDFPNRADNRKQHIVGTHLKTTAGPPRNRRWSKEEAYEYGAGEYWEEAQVANEKMLQALKLQEGTQKVRKSKVMDKLPQRSKSKRAMSHESADS